MSEQESTDVPTGSSEKAAGKEQIEDLPFEAAHNCCVFMGDLKKHTEFTGIVDFLKRSRVIVALATPDIIYKDHQQEFWKNAKMDYWNNEYAVVSTIQGEFVIISEDDIREALKLTDKKTDPRVLSWVEQRMFPKNEVQWTDY
jgi:hypothetical protein